jgi:flagellin
MEVVMAFSTGSRINTNVAAYNALNALNNVTRDMSVHQLRLSSGKRINSASDDASGYVISKKMEARVKSLQAEVDNIGDSQSSLGVAEGGYQTIADLLTQIKQKQTRASNASFGADEKTAVASEVGQLMQEIDSINTSTQFNGNNLLDNATTGATALLGTAANAVTSANIASLSVDVALGTVNAKIGDIGAQENRLTVEEANMNTAITNTQAAMSRIMDADVASEQIASVKNQILLQTATAQLSQANSSPQVFLSLFK